MELEPISSPTNCLLLFPPNNDIWQPLYSFALLLLLPPSCVRLAHLAFHPAIQDGLSEFPAVTEFERRNFAFSDVTVQGIRADPQILRRLPHIHHFTRFIHEVHHSRDTHTPERLLPDATLRTAPCVTESASRVSVIPLRKGVGQAFNACSCPKNTGNRRQ